MDLTENELTLIKKMALKFSHKEEDAEDIASESILKLLLVAEPDTHRKRYITQTTKRTAFNFYRLPYQKRSVLKDQFLDSEMPSQTPRYENYDPLWNSIMALPYKQQRAALYKLLDYKNSEVQQLTNENYDALKANLRHSLQTLKKELAPLYR